MELPLIALAAAEAVFTTRGHTVQEVMVAEAEAEVLAQLFMRPLELQILVAVAAVADMTEPPLEMAATAALVSSSFATLARKKALAAR